MITPWNMNWRHPSTLTHQKHILSSMLVNIRLFLSWHVFDIKMLLNCEVRNQNKRSATKTNRSQCTNTAKFSKENIPSYNVSERSVDGAKQKRGKRRHWRRRWADSGIIWRKYYRGGIQGAPGGRGPQGPPERLITRRPIRQRLANYVLMADWN